MRKDRVWKRAWAHIVKALTIESVPMSSPAIVVWRDELIGQALTGIIASTSHNDDNVSIEKAAELATRYADAVILKLDS